MLNQRYALPLKPNTFNDTVDVAANVVLLHVVVDINR